MPLALAMPGAISSLVSRPLLGAALLCMLINAKWIHAFSEGDSCEIKDLSAAGQCMSASKCEPNLRKYISTGRLTIAQVPSCGLGPREEIICCPLVDCCPDDGSATTTRTISPTPTTRVDVPLITTVDRPAVVACRNYHSQLKIESLTPHILEGIPVAAGIYPHMAALAYNDFGSFDYRCGGSLISPRYVLTAAHCLNTATPVFVRLGAVNIEVPSMGYQDINIVNFTIHPEYVSNSKYHDIALMELEHDATMNDFISPACLETNLSDPPLQSSLFVTGWGTMNQTTRERSKVLLRAPLDVVPLLQCNESIAEQPNGIRLLKQGVIDSLVCAADKRRQKADACSGDSGGPLIYERNLLDGNFTILGIISSGFGCATKTPGLYTRVASYLDFIEKIVWPNY